MAKILLFATLFVFVGLIANSHQASTLIETIETMLKVGEPSPNKDCTENSPVNCGTFCCPQNYRYKTVKYIFYLTFPKIKIFFRCCAMLINGLAIDTCLEEGGVCPPQYCRCDNKAIKSWNP